MERASGGSGKYDRSTLSGRLRCRWMKYQLFFKIVFRVWDFVDGEIIYISPKAAWQIAGSIWDF